MFKSLEFDDYVVAELSNRKLNRSEQQSELPPYWRSKAVAIVEARNWNERPEDAQVISPYLPKREEILTGPSAVFGMIGVAAILCGIVFGFLFESTLIVYLSLLVALLSIGTAVVLQSRRADGIAAAFGIAPTPNGTLTPQQFVEKQMQFAALLKGIACAGACMLFVLILKGLAAIDQMTLGADDSVVAASIRSGTIFLIAIAIWSTLNSWKKSGIVFQFARWLRGFLALNLSPLWVSWLYEAKSKFARPDVSDRSSQTIKQIAFDNAPLLAFFLFSVVFQANPQWLNGIKKPGAANRGKSAWVSDVVFWMSQHPASIMFMGAMLGSFSIAFFSHQLSASIKPQFAGGIAIVVFLLSILLFAAIGAA